MSSLYNPPSDAALINLFTKTKCIAVVGLSPKPDRPSHQVAKHMQTFGFDIIPVRPAVTEVLGEKAYKSLLDIPFQVDLVDVFRASNHVAEIADQCLDTKVKAMWLQEGVVDEASAVKTSTENIFTVMNKCIYKEYMRLMK